MARLYVKHKQCTSCGLVKALDQFYKNKAHKTDGHTARCAECQKAAVARWRATPRGAMKVKKRTAARIASGEHTKKQQEYRKTERGRACMRQYAQTASCKSHQSRYQRSKKGRTTAAAGLSRRIAADPEKYRAKWRRWNKLPSSLAASKRYLQTPHGRAQKRTKDARRRAITRHAATATLTTTDWLEIMEQQNGRCHYCHKKRALTMDHVMPLSRGGQHTPENVVGACMKCNRKKGSKVLTLF